MKYNKEYIQDLLDKFIEGQTTENEEQKLAEFFANTEDIPAEWMPYKEMFLSFKTDAYDFTDGDLDEMLQPEPARKSRIISILPWLSAACVAAVVALFVMHPWSNATVEEQPSIAQIKPRIIVEKKDSITKQPAALAETQVPANEPKKPKKQSRTKSSHKQDISTAELLETIEMLADISPDDAEITVRNTDNGYLVNTTSKNGESNSYMMRRCSNSSSIELTNQSVDL